MIRPKSPCYGCEKRELGCRTDCGPWQEYEKAHSAYLEEKERSRKSKEDVAIYQRDAIRVRRGR